MKKTIISVMLTISLVFTLLCGIQMNARNPYTIPLAVTPPEIDGVMSEDEWKGAYHYQINNQIGYQWSSNPSQKEGCTMFDLYMMWYNDPEESGELLDVKKGGIYIAVKAQDPERGYAYPDGGAFNGADAIQFAIDPFNYQDTNPSSAYLFDLAPYTASMDPDQPFGPASNYEHWQWNGKIPAQFKMTQEATVTADGYLMEVFIPWSVMHQYEMLPDHGIGTVMGMGFVFMDFIQQSPLLCNRFRQRYES